MTLDDEERRKAARLLRRIVADFTEPDDAAPVTPRGAAMLRRLEGAALALETDLRLDRQPGSESALTANDR